MQSGMLDEAKMLLQKGITLEKMKFFGLEYKYLAMLLNNEITYDEMFNKLNRDIAKFAKRQMTWFRKIEREGTKINWIAPHEFEKAKKMISEFLSKGTSD